MYATGAIITAGTQQQEPIYRLFTLLKQDVKNFLVSTYISPYVVTTRDETGQVGGTLALLDLANLAEKNQWKGPSDLAINHDKYFIEAWEEEVASKKRDGK